ncbi:Obg family GTPase CgtA [Blochmannia endosymbiont of Camponotus (Colobopsis) obliquus]|uniref:Obg family GTPase CgtA n=1 Tax=Blochmannia endosymbiont of Camponotus (Colobopsis) obliquus TaxID=1505597 RepID=UPI00061A543D|nr:Obg family GTPase CgtA [Blochmannia endosymbiont of Camponotus (Colobopsis) obliquus]AKC60268.1 GTPase ObgE/CgtA [Blochmannia endosymbiont of Camponotus (Colobopsis) obliquus]
MKFIDKVNILVQAGHGGNGYIKRFNKKYNTYHHIQMNSNGGDGGDVYLLADKNTNTLNNFLLKKIFLGNHGQNGKSRGRTGKRGADTIIKVPIGTIVYNVNTKQKIGNLLYHKQHLMIAKGGRHGIGNNYFCKPYVNYDMQKYKKNGKEGEKIEIQLELILITDIGILGLPNTGKSTFLNKISTAKTQVAEYPFTTLIPQIGKIKNNNYEHNYSIIEIPGLIQGSYNGSGLGIKFLKHLIPCKILLHFIELKPLNTLNIIKNINIINNELKYYNNELTNKTCWLIFNKIDLMPINEAIKQTKQILSILKWKNKHHLISGIKNYGIKELCIKIKSYLKKHK